MKLYLSIFTLVFSGMALANFDFSIGPEVLQLQTKDHVLIKNAQFDYIVSMNHLEIPCTSDGVPTGFKCWRPRSIKSERLDSGALGAVTISAQHFHSDSSRDKVEENPLSVGIWGVYTPFVAGDGKTYQCVAISPYTLQQENIGLTPGPDFSIDATEKELQVFLDKYVDMCRKNVDEGKYKNTPYVLPN
jgi:hypothetical protein